MTFFESIKTVFRKYAEFEGRATRSEFWWFTLFASVVSLALGSLNVTTGPSSFGAWNITDQSLASYQSTIYLGSSLAGVWAFAVLIPSLAVSIRRLRDAGHEWQNIFWILLPIAGIIILIIWWAEPSKTDAIAIEAAPQAPPAPPAA